MFSTRVAALRFFFSITCGCDHTNKYVRLRTEPRKLPIMLSAEEISAFLVATPGLGTGVGPP